MVPRFKSFSYYYTRFSRFCITTQELALPPDQYIQVIFMGLAQKHTHPTKYQDGQAAAAVKFKNGKKTLDISEEKMA